MVDFGAPYAMDGTIIPGEGLRRQLQRDVGAGSGVVRPGDLKITQMTPPGAGVKIAAGDDLIQSGDPSKERETYGIPLFTDQNYMGDDGQGLPGTGSQVPSGGRRDLVFHEVLDPGLPKYFTPKENWPEGASSKLSVIQNVPKSAKRIEDVPALAGVTGYALAAITYPADTATITNAMIEDLRVVQNPRTVTEMRSMNMTVKQILTGTNPYPTGGMTFPAETQDMGIDLDVPRWATIVKITAIWGSVAIPSGNASGQMWVQVAGAPNPDNFKTQAGGYNAIDNGGFSRETWMVSDTKKLPASMRGTRQRFYPRARVDGAVPAAQRPWADWGTSFVLLVVFQEVAD